MKKTINRNRILIGVALLLLVSYGGYVWWKNNQEEATVTSAMSLYQVVPGAVTNGIKTTGTIKAAEVLDLNVYKLTTRIDAVAALNGTHVEAGDLILAFDQSDTAVMLAQSDLDIRSAQLTQSTTAAGADDLNITIASLKDGVAVLERNLTEYEKDKRDALRDFLNADRTAEAAHERSVEQVTHTAPTVSGLYNASAMGEYRLRVYASRASSGYSYELSGLEGGTYDVFPGVATPLGTRGLKITFPQDVVARDVWVVAVPNVYAPTYATNKQAYETALAQADESMMTDTVALHNKQVQLAQAERSDTDLQRNLTVESARLAVEKAKVSRQANVDTQQERRVIAPFAGTVEGMENVVVGATPSKESTDSVNFGSLISDEFLVSFSLSANDVNNVQLGDKVIVTLASLPGSAPLEASITEIRSLPDSSAVAQYPVSARITQVASSTVRLRDGMLADIEIVREERNNVLRVPVAALSYASGDTAQVTVVSGLTDDQMAQFTEMGIVRTDTSVPEQIERRVSVGLRGTYYAEISEGLTNGDLVLVSASKSATEDASTVVRTGFGVGRPPSDRQSSNTTSGSNSTRSSANQP